MNELPKIVKNSVLVKSEFNVDEHNDLKKCPIKGFDFNTGIDYEKLLNSYLLTGFQATCFAKTVNIINSMIHVKFNEPFEEDSLELDEFIKRKSACTIFLSYTSNLVSCGLREIIKFLVQHKYVDCLVSTAGGIEEDIIKCLADTYLGDFNLNGKILRSKGINRIGNLIIPNENYCKFEEWIIPIFDQLLFEQQKTKTFITPSKLIEKLGLKINNEDSICYWAAKNKIPIFCPAITDGSIGDMLYFHAYKNPGLIIDIVQDIKRINNIAVKANKSGMIILGGGVIKHHTCNANLMRNGADYSVFINTGQEFDGSDSGASPDEAVSWGKIKKEANPVKICADASLVFPLIVSQTFAKHHFHCKK